MRFNLNLDESLFDDEFDINDSSASNSYSDEFDDDFSEYMSDHSAENVLPGPAEGSDTGIAAEVIALINDEWEAIQGYNDAIATFRANSTSNPFYEDAIKVLEEIVSEENTHVGQLQEVLRRISPNAAEIQKGTKEAQSQLSLVAGKLPVQSWDTAKIHSHDTAELATPEEEICTLSDIDDEM